MCGEKTNMHIQKNNEKPHTHHTHKTNEQTNTLKNIHPCIIWHKKNTQEIVTIRLIMHCRKWILNFSKRNVENHSSFFYVNEWSSAMVVFREFVGICI